jgi:WD40 repeat protein
LLTGSRDNTARLFDLEGRELAVFPHEETVVRAAFSPDGERVVTACTDAVARVWNLRGSCLLSLRGHEGMLSSAAFDPRGEFLVTASFDGTGRIWYPRPQTMLEIAASVLGRDFRPSERLRYAELLSSSR